MGFGHWPRFGDIKRVQSLCRTSFIHGKSEHEIADNDESPSRWQHERHWQAFANLGYVYVFNRERSRFSSERLLGQFAFHQKYRRETYREEFVRSVSKIDSKTRIGNLMSVTKKLGNFSMERLSLVNDKEVINLSMARVYVFSDSVLCLGKVRPFPQSNVEWETKLQWFKVSKHTENRVESTENQWNSSGRFTQDSPRCRFSSGSKKWWKNWIVNQNNAKEESWNAEERIAAKSKPMVDLVSRNMAGSSTAPSSTTPTSSVSLRAYSHGLGLMAGAVKPVATSTEKPRCYRFKQMWRCEEHTREAERGEIDNWHGETRCMGLEPNSELSIWHGETRCMEFGHRNWFGDTTRIRDFCRINATDGKSTHQIANNDESPPWG